MRLWLLAAALLAPLSAQAAGTLRFGLDFASTPSTRPAVAPTSSAS